MNPANVDVNVHPSKLEVRFEEENKIFQSIYHAIKDTLLKSELVVNTSRNPLEVSFNSEKLHNKQSNGLFGFRKNNEKQIEKYTEEESKIKTNQVKDEEFYKSKPMPGGPFDTSDVLEQLKKMKEKLQKEIEEKKTTIGLSDVSAEYKLETKQENNKEQQEEVQKENEINEFVETKETEQSKNNESKEQAQLYIENSQEQEVKKEENGEYEQQLEGNQKTQDEENQEQNQQENNESQEKSQQEQKEETDNQEKSENQEQNQIDNQENCENQEQEQQQSLNVENHQIDEADKIIENIEDPEIKKEFEIHK